MARFDHLTQKERRQQRARRPASRGTSLEVAMSEWHSAPQGRLGRLLQVDIERYLEFFAIARDEEGPAPGTAVTSPRALTATRSRRSMLDL